MVFTNILYCFLLPPLLLWGSGACAAFIFNCSKMLINYSLCLFFPPQFLEDVLRFHVPANEIPDISNQIQHFQWFCIYKPNLYYCNTRIIMLKYNLAKCTNRLTRTNKGVKRKKTLINFRQNSPWKLCEMVEFGIFLHTTATRRRTVFWYHHWFMALSGAQFTCI